ncbi:homeobox protein Mohawk-like [Corythoichthys intestinalis]|uniref:homeobox protein Mohawk-like n=1 Tax=Corythoichthys intestinalis TaxID=161448 RepID=UPI0025A667EA|nr:homeobox protein Mohawk-like [Corythoichthys intestinalis]
MNTVIGMASETRLHLEVEEINKRNYVTHTSLTSARNADLLQFQETSEDSSCSKYRKYGCRMGGVKVRHKRQVLQDMARPLKHWLYKHRDNPYPTKTEKVLLALGSHMTLVQVSNWFANARRRLKNTVRQPDLSWALRIKLYNKYIQGNAERLSVCSNDTDSDDDDCPLQTPICSSDMGTSSSHIYGIKNQGGVLTMADPANSDDGTSPPSKYKSSLLNRYLNDTLRHMMASKADGVALKRRSHSESFSSNDGERDAVSPASSYDTETNFIYQKENLDYTSSKCDSGQPQERDQQSQNNQDWREINAAVALTSLAHGQSCKSKRTPLSTAAGLSCYRASPSITRRKTSITVATLAPRQSSTERSALTSRIIQRSSHISEVQTIKVGLANNV